MKHYSKDELSAYLDRELPNELLREISSHLDSCPSCNQIIEKWSTLGNVLSREKAFPENEDFVAAIMTRVDPPMLEGRSTLAERFTAWLLPAVQVLASVVLLVIQYSNTETVDMDSILLAGINEESIFQEADDNASDFTTIFGFYGEEL